MLDKTPLHPRSSQNSRQSRPRSGLSKLDPCISFSHDAQTIDLAHSVDIHWPKLEISNHLAVYRSPSYRNFACSIYPAFRNRAIRRRKLGSAMRSFRNSIIHLWSTLSKKPLISTSTM